MRFVNRATGAVIEPPEGAERIYTGHLLYEVVPESVNEARKAAVKKRAPKSAEKEEAT